MLGKKYILFLSFFWIVACQPSAGLVRTNFENFCTKRYHSLGFSLELPIQKKGSSGQYIEVVYDSDMYKQNSNTLGELSLAFHPIYGTHLLSEPVYLIDLSIVRLSEKQFGLFEDNRHYLMNSPCFQKISPGLSKNLTEEYVCDSYNRREYECFFQTIQLRDGDVLICLGQILLDNSDTFEIEKKSLIRMINSITIHW